MITAEILKQKLEDDLFSAALEIPSVKADYYEAIYHAKQQAIKRAADLTLEFKMPPTKKDTNFIDIYNIYKEL